MNIQDEATCSHSVRPSLALPGRVAKEFSAGELRVCTKQAVLPVLAALSIWAFPATSPAAAPPSLASDTDLWALAQRHAAVHRFSTLFDAGNVRDHLTSDSGLEKAIQWCKATAVTKVYLEEFRDGYTADRATLVKAREAFRAAGIETSGCITTTHLGKDSTGWKTIACFTDPP